jgi:hypothetical protein
LPSQRLLPLLVKQDYPFVRINEFRSSYQAGETGSDDNDVGINTHLFVLTAAGPFARDEVDD